MSQLAQMMIGARWLSALVLLSAVAAPRAVQAVNTCNAVLTVSYGAPNYAVTGTTKHVTVTLGANGINGGTALTVNRLRFYLDCTETGLGVPCTDLGSVIEYEGNLTSTCPGTF